MFVKPKPFFIGETRIKFHPIKREYDEKGRILTYKVEPPKYKKFGKHAQFRFNTLKEAKQFAMII